jgi:hypothetical protein
MSFRIILEPGTEGFVKRSQLWLNREDSGVRLYVMPRFLERAQATPDMLRVTRITDQARGKAPYAIYLPKLELFGRLTQHVTLAQAERRSLFRVERVFVINDKPGEKPFATIPGFYFPS